jgi:hypothetical protein
MTAPRAVDFDVHGIVSVRLVDAGPGDVAAVRRVLGAFEGPLARRPDVSVRFVDRIPLAGLRHVELGRSGFTDDGFVLLARGGRRGGVLLPPDWLEGPCEIACERGQPVVPVLLPLVRLLALGNGFVPLHASGFELRGAGIIAAGWAHGGKTSALLAFAERGARYVGDDLILLRADGQRMYGVPGPLELWDWQVRGVPAARERAGRARVALGGAARRLGALEARLSGSAAEGTARRTLRRALGGAQRRLKAELSPEEVFGGRTSPVATPRAVFLMTSHAASDVVVEPTDVSALAERLALSVQQEMLGLVGHYLAFRFAFPERRSALLEATQPAAAGLLRGALAGVAAFVVRHPYPVPLAALHHAMRPHCEAPCVPTA